MEDNSKVGSPSSHPHTHGSQKDFAPPKTAAELRDLLGQLIEEIRKGRLDPKLANSISRLGMGFLRAHESSDLEARVAALEARKENKDENFETAN